MTIRATFDGHAFVPDQPVNLPVGFVLEIAFEPPAETTDQAGRSSLARLVQVAEQFPENPDLPSDLAAQHDHYLYGTQKRP